MKYQPNYNQVSFKSHALKSTSDSRELQGFYGVGDWDGTQVWIEAGTAPELRIMLASYYNAYFHQGEPWFWLPVNKPDGTLIGWIKFDLSNKIHGCPLFSATEMRLAGEEVPELGMFITDNVQYPVTSLES